MALGIAVAIVLATAVGAIGYGRRAGARPTMVNWAVGGRRFGPLLFWFMNAGEVYTIFALLGISGYAFAMGAPAYLAFTSVSLSYALGYWLMPKIWRAGRRHDLITQPDFFAARYDAPWLGVVTGVVGIAALVVYVQIQLVSLRLIVDVALGGVLPEWAAVALGAVLMLAFVMTVGLRSAVFSAAVKDVLVVGLAVTVAARVGAASMLDVFRLAEERHPGIGWLPGLQPEAHTDTVWLMTSALNVALGNWVFPHLFQVSFSARSATAIRRNAVWQPLYSLSYFFIVLLGFAALLGGVQPTEENANGALVQLVSQSYPAWVVGVFAGTCFLLAMAPGSVLLITMGSTFARNVLRPLRPGLTDRGAVTASRLAMVALAGVAVWLTLRDDPSLVRILLYAYAAIGMLAPGVFLAFLWRRTTAIGVLAGIVAGFVALLAPFATGFWSAALPNWEPGLLAMGIDAVVIVAVSLVTRPPGEAAVAVGVGTAGVGTAGVAAAREEAR